MNNLEQARVQLGPSGFDKVLVAMAAAADAARLQTLPRFRTGVSIENKSARGFDPVTEADREAERAIRAVLEAHFPDHGIIGEEFGVHDADADFVWAIDPIDGTRSFIAGVPMWGTLIGLLYRGKSIAGLMDQPFTGERFVATPDGGAFLRGDERRPLKTSGCTRLEEARIFTTTPKMFHPGTQQNAWEAVEADALQTRYGCDCYAYCLVAAGHGDLVMEANLNVYDIAALVPIVEAAGGVIRSFDGGPPDGGGDVIAAATTELYEAARRAIAARP